MLTPHEIKNHLPLIMNENKVTQYLDNTVRNIIEDDVIRIAYYQCNSKLGRNEGYFDIPRQVFCIVDFLGYLMSSPRDNKGHDTSYRAIKFIELCFPARYKNIAPLIYQQWRHDTVHTLLPKKYIINFDKEVIKLNWLSSRSTSKESLDVHMLPMYQLKSRNDITIIVNIVQLAEDLLLAFDNFMEKLKNNDELRKECTERFDFLFEYQEPNEICRDAIIKSWENPAGILNEKNVYKVFKHKR